MLVLARSVLAVAAGVVAVDGEQHDLVPDLEMHLDAKRRQARRLVWGDGGIVDDFLAEQAGHYELPTRQRFSLGAWFPASQGFLTGRPLHSRGWSPARWAFTISPQ